MNGVAIQMCGRRFVVPVEQVAHVFRLQPVTPVPGTEAWLCGVLHVFGELRSVIDLAPMMGRPSAWRPGARLVVVGGQPSTSTLSGINAPGIVLVMDEVLGLRAFDDADFDETREPVDAMEPGPFAHCVTGRYTAPDGVWPILDLSALARHPMIADAASASA